MHVQDGFPLLRIERIQEPIDNQLEWPGSRSNKAESDHDDQESVKAVFASEYLEVSLVDYAQVSVNRDGYVDNARCKYAEVGHKVKEDGAPQADLFVQFLNPETV